MSGGMREAMNALAASSPEGTADAAGARAATGRPPGPIAPGTVPGPCTTQLGPLTCGPGGPPELTVMQPPTAASNENATAVRFMISPLHRPTGPFPGARRLRYAPGHGRPCIFVGTRAARSFV